MIMERMLLLRDSAAMLGVSRNRVHELINSERLASVKPGRSRRISIGRSGGLCTRGWRRHE
jgi:excisionase family DNA binding protein